MRRAKNSEAIDFAAVQKLAQDEPGLDCFADTNVVRDQQPNNFLAQSHHQRS
jgi:hypothetical protein